MSSGLCWVGTYPADGPATPAGRGEGVWWHDLDRGSPRRVHEVPAPSFLAQHPAGRRLYAISEGARGVLTVLAPDGEARPLSDRDAPIGPDGDAGAGRPGALALRSSHDSGGSFPCHVVVDPGGRWLAVAHYGDGVVAAFPLARDGDVSGEPTILAPSGSPGPRTDRQDGPHAHSATWSPDGAVLLVADLGTDELRRYRLDGTAPPQPDGVACLLPPGSGPRHLAFRTGSPGRGASGGRNTVYVTLELSGELAVLGWDARSGAASLTARHALPRGVAGGETLPSHLVVDGDRLHVGVRGPDVIASFGIGADGALTALGATPTVAWPRHFAVLRDWLVVAGERAGALGRHSLVGSGGAVGELAIRDLVPAPACVVDAAGWRS